MRAIGRYSWLVFASLLAAAGCVFVRPPPAFLFDKPPYSAVVNGLPGGNGKVPASLPAMVPGEGQSFLFCCGAIHAGTCAGEIRLVVDAARHVLKLPLKNGHAAVECAKAAVTLTMVRRRGGLAVAKDVLALGKKSSSGRVRTMGHKVDLNVMSGTSVLATVVSTDRLKANRSSGSAAPVAAAGVSGVNRVKQTGGFGAVDESRSVSMLVDSDFVRILIDANLVDGFYDAKNILMAPALEVPPEELAAFQTVFEKGGPVSNLVNRAFSAVLRRDAAAGGSNCVSELLVDVVGEPPFHHGARVLFTVALANKGDGTVYDALILNALPEHAAFSEFPLRDAPRRGFSQTYLPKRKLMVWKLYRPLEPGETFRASYVLNLDPWQIPADWRPPKQKR